MESASPLLARERLVHRRRVAALWLTLATAVAVPAWTVVDRLLEGPELARAFLGPRLVCTVVLVSAAWVVRRRPVGRRHPNALAGLALAPVQVMIGWMVPQVDHPALYVLGGTLMLYATGAVMVATAGWTAALSGLVGVGFALGVLSGSPVDVQDAASWGLYLGTATVAAVVGHELRHRAVLAEVRWATALEAEQQRTGELVVELERLSSEDPLTGLANRRRWDEVLQLACAGAARTGGSVAVLLVDVDHFKAINDTGGHPAGDRALQQVSAVLMGAVRAEDLVARLGGDEFGVLLPDVPRTAAAEVAELVRARVEALAWAGLSVPVTLSIGVAVGEGAEAQLEPLLRTADQLLYRAKVTRNAVVSDRVVCSLG